MRFLTLLLALLLVGCGGDDRRELWIYTSLYPSVIERMRPALEKAFPDVSFKWYQKGSEQVAVRLSGEIASGGVSCDLLMTSDPFYYAELKERGHLLSHESPAVSKMAPDLRDPDHAFATVRIPLMVLAINSERIPAEQAPRSFRDLTEPRFRGKVSMGDPGKSGTSFTTVAALSRKYGWEYFKAMRDNDLFSGGGNSAVLQRLETGERPVGIILLENLLPRIAKGAPLTVIYPEDGAIPVPSPVAIMRSTEHPDLAREVHDFLFTRELQEAIVSGFMYSPFPDLEPPSGGAPWSRLKLYPWNNEFLGWVSGKRAEIKATFRETMDR